MWRGVNRGASTTPQLGCQIPTVTAAVFPLETRRPYLVRSNPQLFEKRLDADGFRGPLRKDLDHLRNPSGEFGRVVLEVLLKIVLKGVNGGPEDACGRHRAGTEAETETKKAGRERQADTDR